MAGQSRHRCSTVWRLAVCGSPTFTPVPTIKAGGFSRFALYDLSTDPLQKKNISKQRPKVTERLKKKLLVLYKDVMADAPDWEPLADTSRGN